MADNSLKRGCWASRTNSNRMLSDVVKIPPACWIRYANSWDGAIHKHRTCNATERSILRCDDTPSTRTWQSMPISRHCSAVCCTHTCVSIPNNTTDCTSRAFNFSKVGGVSIENRVLSNTCNDSFSSSFTLKNVRNIGLCTHLAHQEL